MNFTFKLAFRNIFRNRRRTILTLSAIGIAVLMMVFIQGYMKGAMQNILENTIRLQSGDVKVVHEKFFKKEKMLPLHYSIQNLTSVMSVVETQDQVISAMPRIRFGAQLELRQKTADLLGVAIDPVKETNLGRIKSDIVEGSFWRSGEESGILLGLKAAEDLGAKVGDPVSVLVRTADFSVYLLEYKVRGIFKSGIGFLDKSFFYLNIKDAADLLNMPDMGSEIVIMLEDRERAQKVAVSILENLTSVGLADGLAVLPWQEQTFIARLMKISGVWIVIMIGIIATVAGLAILNTMLMSVFERSKEIGMMRALGMRKGAVIKLIIAEAIIIGMLGGFCGALIGGSFSYFYMERVGLDYSSVMESIEDWFFDPIVRSDFSLMQTLIGFIFGITLTTAATLYPAYRAARMKPAESLRAA